MASLASRDAKKRERNPCHVLLMYKLGQCSRMALSKSVELCCLSNTPGLLGVIFFGLLITIHSLLKSKTLLLLVNLFQLSNFKIRCFLFKHRMRQVLPCLGRCPHIPVLLPSFVWTESCIRSLGWRREQCLLACSSLRITSLVSMQSAPAIPE